MTAAPAEFPGQQWEVKLLELTRGIIQHGNGQLTFSSTEIKGGERKIIIEAGRRYVYFLAPELTRVAGTL